MNEMDTAIAPRAREDTETGTATVQERAEEAKTKGSRQLQKQLDDRTTQAGQQARSLAEALRRSSLELAAGDDTGGVSRIASGAADRIERLGGYLEGASGDDMLRDAERVARRRPWLVAGAAALVGLAASRVLKASSEGRYGSGSNGAGVQGAV